MNYQNDAEELEQGLQDIGDKRSNRHAKGVYIIIMST
jgi:hypothetical protein